MKFESGIPLPDKKKSKAETLLMMKVGESFTVEKSEVQAWRCAMSRAAEIERSHFISRAVGSDRIRIWRDA